MNKNLNNNYYEEGEIFFGICPPNSKISKSNSSWIKLDGSTATIKNSKFAKKLNKIAWNTSIIGNASVTNISQIVYGNGTWIGYGTGGLYANLIRSFNNGKSWTARIGLTQAPQSIVHMAYGGNTWMALGQNGLNFPYAIFSADNGASWTDITTALNVPYPPGIYGTLYSASNNTWVFYSNQNTRIRYSTRANIATTWTTIVSPFNSGATRINSLAYGGGIWVAGGVNGSLSTSTDEMLTWNTQSSNFGTSTITGLVYTNSTFFATGANGTLRTSTDAISWNTKASWTTTEDAGFRLVENSFVALGATGSYISDDYGDTWGKFTFPQNINTNAVYGNGIWMRLSTPNIISIYSNSNEKFTLNSVKLTNNIYGWLKI